MCVHVCVCVCVYVCVCVCVGGYRCKCGCVYGVFMVCVCVDIHMSGCVWSFHSVIIETLFYFQRRRQKMECVLSLCGGYTRLHLPGVHAEAAVERTRASQGQLHSLLLAHCRTVRKTPIYMHTDSNLFYSRLCPSTAGSSPPPVFHFSLSFAILVHTTPCCLTMSSLQPRFGLPTDLTPSVCHSVLLIVFHSGDVSSPFPFRIGCVLDYVCHRLFYRKTQKHASTALHQNSDIHIFMGFLLSF